MHVVIFHEDFVGVKLGKEGHNLTEAVRLKDGSWRIMDSIAQILQMSKLCQQTASLKGRTLIA